MIFGWFKRLASFQNCTKPILELFASLQSLLREALIGKEVCRMIRRCCSLRWLRRSSIRQQPKCHDVALVQRQSRPLQMD